MRGIPVRPAGALLALLALGFTPGGATAGERWLEVRSPHFRVITDAGEKDGRSVASGFEQLRALFASLGNMRVDPPAPIVVLATRDEGGMRSFLPSFWERRGGVRPAGVFMGGVEAHHIAVRLDVPQEYRDDVVFHEYVHLIAKLNFAALPLWLSEGLAEFYAGTTVRDGNVVYGRVNSDDLDLLQERAPLALDDLFAIDGGSREYNEEQRVSVLYAESALLTHYLLVADEGAHRPKLSAYLRLLGEGVPPEQAQAQAFGDLRSLEKKFFDYIRGLQRRGRSLALTAPLDVAGATAAVRPLAEAEVLTVRGEFLARSGSVAEARGVLARAREMDPKLAAAARALGVVAEREARNEEAARNLADAMRLDPDDFAAQYLWAQAVIEEPARLAAAEAALRRAVQLNPSFAPAHALLSYVLRRRGDLQQAFLSLHKACELEPSTGTYWVQRADLLRDLKRPDVAEKIEAELARIAVSDREQLQALAAYYRASDRLDDLERLLRRSADLSPRNALAPLMLGEHLRQSGRAEEAEAALRRALAAQPHNPSILNTLAYHNADRGVKLAESLELVERALKAYPNDAAMLDTKGWTLFRMGRLPEAEALIRRSLAQEEHAEVLEHLGDVLDRSGQRAGALDAWRRALEHPGLPGERTEALRSKLGPAPSPAP